MEITGRPRSSRDGSDDKIYFLNTSHKTPTEFSSTVMTWTLEYVNSVISYIIGTHSNNLHKTISGLCYFVSVCPKWLWLSKTETSIDSVFCRHIAYCTGRLSKWCFWMNNHFRICSVITSVLVNFTIFKVSGFWVVCRANGLSL